MEKQGHKTCQPGDRWRRGETGGEFQVPGCSSLRGPNVERKNTREVEKAQ